jgi:hypothetical protein
MRLKMLVMRRMKSGSFSAQMEKKKSGRGKREDLPNCCCMPIYRKTNQMVLPNQASSRKKSKLKHEGIQTLVDAGQLQVKARVGWNTAVGDAWQMEKNWMRSPCLHCL